MYVCMYVHSRSEAGLNLNVFSSVIHLCTIYVCICVCILYKYNRISLKV